MIRKHTNGDYIVDKHTGISIGLIVVLLMALAGAVSYVKGQDAEVTEVATRLDAHLIQCNKDNYVTESEFRIYNTNIEGRLTRIEDKLDRLIEQDDG